MRFSHNNEFAKRKRKKKKLCHKTRRDALKRLKCLSLSKKKRWIFMVLTLALRCVYFFSTPWICLKFEFQTDWVYLFNSQSIFRDKISIWTHLIFRPLTKQLHWNKWIAIFQRKYYEWHKHINFIAMIVAFWKLQGS